MYRFMISNLFLFKFLLIMLSVLIASPSFAFAAQSNTVTPDLRGHWAEKQITQWSAKGLIAGYPDGTFQPDHSITRVEFITFVNRALKLTGQADVGFSDVSAGSWEHGQVATALSAGYISGYEDGMFHPGQKISREEAASVLNRVLKLEPNAEAAAKFSDANLFSNWSKGDIGALVEKSFVTGFADGTFRPGQSMTRAETVVILDRVLDTKTVAMTYDQKGIYGPESGTQVIEGNVVISAEGVTLRNTLINGDLLLASSIGDGEVFLKGVTVKGTTDIQGGGVNSVYLEDSVLLSIIVNREDGTVRVVTEGSTSVQSVTLQSSAVLQASAQGVRIEDVILSSMLPANAEATLQGSFSNLSVQATSIRVNLSGGTIENLLIGAQAALSTVNLDASATVSSMVLDAATTVTGTGTIHRADVNTNGSSFDRLPQIVNTPPGVIILNRERTTNGTPGNTGPVKEPPQPAGYTVIGQILDADNQPVNGMTITFRQDWFTTSGPVLATVVTDPDGHYTITLPPGKYTGDLSKQGFLDSSLYLLIESNGTISGQDKKAVRIPQSEETRIVLYWGQLPLDIDSHLVGPTPDNNQFHTKYLEKAYYFRGQKYVDLDIDHTKSWGPETTTIRHDVNGVYRFYVHNYSGNHHEGKTLRDSGATIEVYRGSSTVPVASYQIPSGTGDELYYTAFEMTLNDGEASFTEINQFYATEQEAQGNNATINKAYVSSWLYSVNYSYDYSHIDVATYSDNVSVEDFKSGLTLPAGASLEVFKNDGRTVRTGNIAYNDKVTVTAPNGVTKVTYSVNLTRYGRSYSLRYSPDGGMIFTTPTPQAIVAYMLYNDGYREDVTQLATYQVQDSAVATVDENGLVTPVADGQTNVEIRHSAFKLYMPVTVSIYTPIVQSLSVQQYTDLVLTSLDKPLPFNIIAYYLGGATEDVTSRADYVVEDPSLLSVDRENGTLKALGNSGITHITVTYGGKSLTLKVFVSLPDSPLVNYLYTQPYTVLLTSLDNPQSFKIIAAYIGGTSGDVTSRAEYYVANSNLITVDPENGTLKASGNSGITYINVTYGGKSLTLKVIVSLPDSPLVSHLQIEPSGSFRFTSPNNPQSFKITAIYYGGTSEDVTSRAEYSTNVAVIAVDHSNGTLNAAGQSGNTEITVNFGGHSRTMYATVVLAPVASSNGPNLKVTNLHPNAEILIYDATSQQLIAKKSSNWYSETEFTNLKSGTPYYVVQRYYGITSDKSNIVTL